jgi:hypothetical protein
MATGGAELLLPVGLVAVVGMTAALVSRWRR